MIGKLKRIPLFLPLISLFFVLHGVLENFGFIPVGDALILLLAYLGLTLIIGAIAWLFLRNRHRAAILATAFIAFFFFYEAFIQFVAEHFPRLFFTSGNFLLALGLLALIGFSIYIKRTKKRFPRLYLFLNTILLIYTLVDAVWLAGKLLHPPANPLAVYPFAKEGMPPPCPSCPRPNVYFLLFDEYASSLALKEQYGFDNALDTFLVKEGFHINGQNSANYNLTAFSMASVLNMSYIEGLKNPHRLGSQDYINTYQLIRDNTVIELFSREGYDIKNYSIFDLAGQPTQAWQSFLPIKTRLITARTLAERFTRNSNSFFIHYLGIKYFMVRDYMKYSSGNETFLKEVAAEADRKSSRPKFLYAHFMMPHLPFLFDSAGRRKKDAQVYEEMYTNPVPAYLGYVQYTNKRLEEVVGHIRQRDPGAVILLCGDHGYRGWIKEQKPFFQFQNLNAVYFPDQDYSRWEGKTTFVNQFRIVFNQLFKAGYPLLKDSTVFLSE